MHAWQDVKVSGEYVRDPEINNLALYCDISQQIAFNATFQWSITTYNATVCTWLSGLLQPSSWSQPSHVPTSPRSESSSIFSFSLSASVPLLLKMLRKVTAVLLVVSSVFNSLDLPNTNSGAVRVREQTLLRGHIAIFGHFTALDEI